jgi:hypothetical protein
MPRADLEAAAAAGLLTAEQVAPLDAFLAARAQPAAPPTPQAAAVQPQDEEDLHFIRNFHDVFLATGIAMLSVGMAIAIGVMLSKLGQGESYTALTGWAGAALCAGAGGVLWSLAEVFSRKRRLFLPSIAICVAFAMFCAASAALGYSAILVHAFTTDFLRSGSAVGKTFAILLPLSALLATLAFYLRFRLPLATGLAGMLTTALLFALVYVAAPNQVLSFYAPICLVMGVALFAVGMAFDMRDPLRQGRLSDNGFWLHLAAAPLLLNGILGLVGGVSGRVPGFGPMFQDGHGNATQAVLTLIVVAILAFVSLLINRRALIVSALVTTGIAVGILMNAAGMGAGGLAASTLLVLGAGVLILGASWRTARRALLARAPQNGLWARAFPPEAPE